jgi:hypothetical protein
MGKKIRANPGLAYASEGIDFTVSNAADRAFASARDASAERIK